MYMELQYIVNDLASILTEYYIRLRNINPDQNKCLIMRLHIKQAIVATYHALYGDDFDNVCAIDVFETHYQSHRYLLQHDFIYENIFNCNTIYERADIPDMLNDMRQRLLYTLTADEKIRQIRPEDNVINIHTVPFDGMGITRIDITSLLDLDVL